MDRKTTVGARRGMRQINKNGIREFVLNSLIVNTIMSKVHGIPLIARNVKNKRLNENIICKKEWYNIHKIPQITFYNHQHYFNHVKMFSVL